MSCTVWTREEAMCDLHLLTHLWLHRGEEGSVPTEASGWKQPLCVTPAPRGHGLQQARTQSSSTRAHFGLRGSSHLDGVLYDATELLLLETRFASCSALRSILASWQCK